VSPALARSPPLPLMEMDFTVPSSPEGITFTLLPSCMTKTFQNLGFYLVSLWRTSIKRRVQGDELSKDLGSILWECRE